MRYRLDPGTELRDGGRVVLGGDPRKLLRLSAAGASALRRWAADGVDDAEASRAERSLVERLVDGGMLHPSPAPVDAPDLVVIVPVRDRVAPLDRCLAALVASGVTDVVVVDDGSRDGPAHLAVAERHGVAVVTRGDSGGPAAARMSGWAEVMSRDIPPGLVAFVDSDVEVPSEWWSALAGHFSAPNVGLVAPRVAHVAGDGFVDRYEAANSPLDLGAHPAAIVGGTRVAYVPAAALVVRSEAFAAVGGFDRSLEVGEDVDLLWRLAGAGWRCRYEPASVVHHSGRTEVVAMLRRRFDYGRSAAQLDARHPGALPPVRGSWWSAAVVASAIAGRPAVAAGLTAWTVRRMAQKLSSVPDAPRFAAELVVVGHVGFARQVARAAVRPWLPITLVLALVSRRVRRLALVGALVAPVLSWRDRRPGVALPTWIVLWLADDIAYTAGVWAGCLERRSVGALTPRSS